MSAFTQACKVEDKSFAILEPYLKWRAYDGRFVRTSKGRLSLQLQKTVGDVLVNSDHETVVCIEVKAEEEHTGNLFLERWSNRSRKTPGWLVTLDTDYLWSHFLDKDIVYEIPFLKLRQYMNQHKSEFKLAKQKKYIQKNDTWGYLVSIDKLREGRLIRQTFHPEHCVRELKSVQVEKPCSKEVGEQSLAEWRAQLAKYPIS
jgi:hypothetical protein